MHGALSKMKIFERFFTFFRVNYWGFYIVHAQLFRFVERSSHCRTPKGVLALLQTAAFIGALALRHYTSTRLCRAFV